MKQMGPAGTVRGKTVKTTHSDKSAPCPLGDGKRNGRVDSSGLARRSLHGNLQDPLANPLHADLNEFPPICIQLRLCRGSISLFADVTLAVIKKILSCTSKKLNEQPADFLWLLLFNPVSGSVNKMDAAHLRTGGALHPLKRTGHLENAPVALAGNEE